MTAPTGSYFNTNSVAIEQVLNKDVEMFLPELDPFFMDTFVSNEVSGNPRDIGRDMHIIKNYHGSMTGVIDQAAGTDEFVLYGDTDATAGGASLSLNAKIHRQELNRTFPDPTLGPNAQSWDMAVPLRGSTTNLLMTLGELQAEATPAVIRDVIRPKLKGFGRNIAHTMCNYLYLSQNDNYALCQTEAVGTNNSYEDVNGGTNNAFRFNPSNEAIDRFAVGQRVWVWCVESSTFASLDGADQALLVASRDFIVTRVDELKNEVDLMHISGGTIEGEVNDFGTETDFNTSGDVADIGWDGTVGNMIVFPQSYDTNGTSFTGYAGLNSWIKTGDTNLTNDVDLLGDEAILNKTINVVTHPEFKSMGVALGGQPLTEHFLRKVTKRFHSAKRRYGQQIDTFLASDGVILAYERQLIGREMLDRTGRLSSLSNQGSDNGAVQDGGFNFTMDGKSYRMYSSCYVDSGTVYGVKVKGGNWKKYTPPSYNGLRTNPDAPAFVPFFFVASALTGQGTNQMAITRTGSGGGIGLVTEGAQMPGFVRMQLVPDQPAGLKLTGVQEDRIYSDN